ncbi:MAG: DNA topoisomerase (ATP-hydrolyzing) subunit A [Clostridia bacterium]|nr:DNA topoisomerase (ATP-hydrolyzing) subunit A [Clostridia bacterium]
MEERITRTLETNYMPYAMSVIISRAIPEIDGFKPSHRKLLYTMYKMGLLKGPRTKSANIAGQTMHLNPHGDAAIYETMVRLTEGNGALIHPFVDSKGNFGRVYSRKLVYAASRYTEAKLAPICEEIFRDIDKNTVDFTDNYDATTTEPLLLPAAFPNILISPNLGVAVGMASNIPSFNLREVCAAACAYIEDEGIDLADYIMGPDFATGGDMLRDEAALRRIFDTGRGSVRVRGRYRYDKKNHIIEIYEIPYTTKIEDIISKVIEQIRANKIKEVNDIRDETDINGLRIAIDLKKGTDPDAFMTRLCKITTFEDVFSANINVLIDGEPRVMGIKELLGEWLRFRTSCVRRALVFDAEKKEDRLHLLKGLEKILLDIDKAIQIVRSTSEDAMVVPNLMEGFGIDKIQAEFVAEIKLRNLNRDYILKRTAEIEQLTKDIADLRKTVGSDRLVQKIISKQLKDIAQKYGKDRITGIIEPSEVEDVQVETFVEDYNLKVFMTRDNYFKKISLVSLRGADVQKLKENDEIICEAEATNRTDMLFFSDRQNVYKTRLYDMADTKASALGDYLPNILDMEDGEKIVFATPAFDYSGFILFAYKNGKMAKITMESYRTKTNRKRLTSGFGNKSPLVGAMYLPSDMLVAAFSDIGKCVVFDTASIATKQSRSSQGVTVMTLRRKSNLRAIALPEASLTTDILSYKARSIPSAGYYLKDEDAGRKQLSLFE